MISRIGVAVAIGAVIFLLCLLGGGILQDLGVPVLKGIGSFLKEWAVVIGFLGGALAFFGGWRPFGTRA